MTETIHGTAPGAERTNSQQIESIQVSKLAKFKSLAITIVNLTVFFMIWELIARAEVINPLFFPRASDIFSALFNGFADGTIWPQLSLDPPT
jgi:ABC-type nitrate/sulfonate/bicarbonate transport system permease component